MKLYNALIKKNKEGKIQDIKLIKEGFSWKAFIFSIFWFLYCKMWKEFFTLLLISISFFALEESNIISGFEKALVELLFSFVIALNANYWLLESIEKKGYEFSGLVFGSDIANAKMRFVNSLESEGAKIFEFDNSIINPKLHRQLKNLEKQKPYFVV